MSEIIEDVRDIATGGAMLMKSMFLMDPKELQMEFKTEDNTPVTIIDREVGAQIRKRIAEQYPNHAVNEEEAGRSGTSDWLWLIDPLDGTSNVKPRFQFSSVGISVEYKGELVATTVVDPFEGIVTFGEKGSGAYTSSIDGSDRKRLSISTGRQPRERFAEIDALFNSKTAERKGRFLTELSVHVQNVRMTGSNILAWSHLVQGRVDVVLTDAIGGPWDIAPGILLMPEVGGKVMNLKGEVPHWSVNEHVIVGVSEEYTEFLSILQRCYEGYEGFR